VKDDFPEHNSVLQRRYKIVTVLHQGENSTVYQARDLHTSHYPPLHKRVAIKKFANPETLPSKQMPFINAFQREVSQLTSSMYLRN
jgi:serine/threonine protein kinase